MPTITVEVDATVYGLLQVLTKGQHAPKTVEDVVLQLIDHAQQGVYRPGAWERNWLISAFADDWIEHLEPGDPYGSPNCDHIFQRPKRLGSRAPARGAKRDARRPRKAASKGDKHDG